MESKINAIERIKMVKAMEYIARKINCEEVFEGWLMMGVADGDVRRGDLSVNEDDPDFLECYISGDSFAELMGAFLLAMEQAEKDGGLYCDGVVSKVD